MSGPKSKIPVINGDRPPRQEDWTAHSDSHQRRPSPKPSTTEVLPRRALEQAQTKLQQLQAGTAHSSSIKLINSSPPVLIKVTPTGAPGVLKTTLLPANGTEVHLVAALPETPAQDVYAAVLETISPAPTLMIVPDSNIQTTVSQPTRLGSLVRHANNIGHL